MWFTSKPPDRLLLYLLQSSVRCSCIFVFVLNSISCPVPITPSGPFLAFTLTYVPLMGLVTVQVPVLALPQPHGLCIDGWVPVWSLTGYRLYLTLVHVHCVRVPLSSHFMSWSWSCPIPITTPFRLSRSFTYSWPCSSQSGFRASEAEVNWAVLSPAWSVTLMSELQSVLQ